MKQKAGKPQRISMKPKAMSLKKLVSLINIQPDEKFSIGYNFFSLGDTWQCLEDMLLTSSGKKPEMADKYSKIHMIVPIRIILFELSIVSD